MDSPAIVLTDEERDALVSLALPILPSPPPAAVIDRLLELGLITRIDGGFAPTVEGQLELIVPIRS